MNKLSHASDEVLVNLYTDGCNEAFDALLDRYKTRLYDYICYQLGFRQDAYADDIFQETFVKVIVYLQERRYTSLGLFNYWLLRIAHNMIADRFRKSDRRLFFKDVNENNDLTRINNDASTVESHDHEMMRNQTFDELHKMVDSLPAEQREIVYLRYFEEMPFKEIAEITGVSINTALGRMRYAIINLRRMANVATL